jgi:pilus assembly protein CpaB
MKMKSVVLLAMAIGCGIVAMLGVQQVLSGDKKPPVEGGKVLVALTPIMPGVPLDDTNVVFKDWPKEQIPPGAVTDPKQYAKRALRVAAVPNEPIMAAKLGEEGVFGATSEIPKGMRVATVPVTMTQTHSGIILPGDRVDVVVTYALTIPGRGQITKTKTILQYIQIFATDNIRQSAVPNGENKEVSAKNISLLVTPDQFNLLMLAENKGKISLALRHRGDSSADHPVTVDDSSFDSNVRVTRGAENKDEESASEGGQKDKSVREALDKENKAGLKVAESHEAPEKATWKLKIYEGEKFHEESVQLPEDAAGAAAKPGNAGGKWNDFFKSLLRGPKDHSA